MIGTGKSLSLHQLHQIRSSKPRIYRFDRGDQLPNYSDFIWQITDGYVRSITWTDDAEIITLGIWGRYDFAGQMLSTIFPYILECLTSVTAVLCADPLARMHEILLHNLQQTEQLLAFAHYRQISERMIAILQWLATRFGESTPSGDLLQVGMTHQQLADLVGITRSTTTRLLKQLEREGRIQCLPKRQILVYPRG